MRDEIFNVDFRGEAIMPLNPGETARLRNLCNLFSIDFRLTEDNLPGALSVTTCLYSMPVIADHFERRRFGNQILQSAHAHFSSSEPKSSQFFALISARVIEIQEFRSWYAEMARSPEELIRSYQSMQRVVTALKFIGVGAGSGAIAAGMKEALKAKGGAEMAKAGAKTTLSRMSGKGAIFEGIEARYGKLPVGGGVALFLIVTAATALYVSLLEEMRKLKIVILDKFQNGQISNELFSKAFTEIDPNSIKKYWEM
ncbi:hypothetical protein [Methylosinus sp. sav-2]|uniref:hypothetical protein n=1 Tax=Methylosinus sp. sav-2 TaxID=2485168 RepID=UPI00047C67EC|nr:hypothetical protein [Methylosinus sp. sav-2]